MERHNGHAQCRMIIKASGVVTVTGMMNWHLSQLWKPFDRLPCFWGNPILLLSVTRCHYQLRGAPSACRCSGARRNFSWIEQYLEDIDMAKRVKHVIVCKWHGQLMTAFKCLDVKEADFFDDWLQSNELKKRGENGKIIMKINCSTDWETSQYRLLFIMVWQVSLNTQLCIQFFQE